MQQRLGPRPLPLHLGTALMTWASSESAWKLWKPGSPTSNPGSIAPETIAALLPEIAQLEPGTVTGFLGPNGAGKSTTMRLILGLDRPTGGQALVNGHPYTASKAPMREVGALLDAKDVHGGRTAKAHLRALAYSNGLPVRSHSRLTASSLPCGSASVSASRRPTTVLLP